MSKDTKSNAGAAGDKKDVKSGAAATSAAGVPELKVYSLDKENELRFEIDHLNKLTVKLLKGTAELFGTELATDKEYHFTNTKAAIFSWHGAEIEVKGGASTGALVYVSADTPMVSYINAHAALENLRKQAESKKAMGPRVMLVGPGDSGKSTLARLLLSYAVRAGWKPTYVDIDVGQNAITIPGALAATAVDHPIAIEGPAFYSSPPIAYFFGHNTPTEGLDLYNKLVERLAAAVDARCAKHPETRHSGCVINTCGMVDEKGRALLIHAALTFKVDVILVLDDERLENLLRHDPKLKAVAVAKLAKSGGAVKRESDFRRMTRNKAIRHYFYGAAQELHPHSKEFKFSEVKVYRAGGTKSGSTSMLPIGSKSLLDPNRLIEVGITKQLNKQILGVSYAKKPEDLLKDNAAGYVYVSKVDPDKQTIQILSPSPQPLPGNMLLLGSLQWDDASF